MEVYSAEYVEATDIFKHFNTNYSDYTFFDMAEDDSYVTIYLSDKAIEEYKEIYKYELEREDSFTYIINQYKNDIELIKYLRTFINKDAILVHI